MSRKRRNQLVKICALVLPRSIRLGAFCNAHPMGCPKEDVIILKRRPRPKTLLLPNPTLYIPLSSPTEWVKDWDNRVDWGSQLNHSGRWTTAGEVFPVRQLGSTEIVADTNLSSELQNAIRRLSRNIPRSSTSFSLGYRPLIKDTPEEDECGQSTGKQQSDAYLVVEAEQIRVIDPVTRAILETIKLSSIRVWAAHQLDIGVVARVGSTDMALVFRCETDAKGVAAAIHANCLRLANEIKMAKEKQRPFSIQDPEPYNQFQVKYVGNCAVNNPTGIETIRDAIGRLLTIHLESEWTPANAFISATTLLLKSSPPQIFFPRNLPLAMAN
ncbi:Oidioi.mRNA.OKI2018_I69.XSR.g14749.t2.cds [Oikopleura dioica]|uniref:Oidioi.mRNA.OKI2018_I69.XSR.g14749.t2.cds n=1 Tax=Oikopleura dioica TaxID=34765 RepID=A0ABN7SB84_OIKDI|nr:Oidioi.mRNA.OKI2018_I69.XSR.g14749.t2.cds [Oikopleura dioica]